MVRKTKHFIENQEMQLFQLNIKLNLLEKLIINN